MVEATDIAYFESESNYTNVHIKKRDKILVAKTLKSFEEQLKFSDFVRVHNSFIVNTQEIDKYIKGDGGYIVMKDNTSIPVSRAHKQNLLERLGLH
jgi:two-component system LytT family response regulator